MSKQIGALLRENGCEFRVWCPHAEAVQVLLQTGTHWDHNPQTQKSFELSRSSDGYWTGFVTGVEAGRLYRYQITNDGRTFERLDSAARDTIHSQLTKDHPASENASIVVTNESYSWSPFETPRFTDFLIYQFHCGTFAGRNDHFNKEIAGFSDIESKFSYIRQLGFNAIEPMPVQEFSQSRSWGYNPAAFFAPESAYGHPREMKHFVDEAHKHGLAVIFEQSK